MLNEPLSLSSIVVLVCFLGALGGLANSVLSGEMVMPCKTPGSFRPGYIGNVFVGAVAALAAWGMYSPLAGVDLLHPQANEFHCTIANLLTSVNVGLGGGRFLTTEAEKLAERHARNELEASFSNYRTRRRPEMRRPTVPKQEAKKLAAESQQRAAGVEMANEATRGTDEEKEARLSLLLAAIPASGSFDSAALASEVADLTQLQPDYTRKTTLRC